MGLKLFFASLAVIGAMALAFGWYFNTTQKRISILTENAAKLEGVVNTQQATITAMEEAAQNTQLNISKLQESLNAAEAQSKKIAELLATTDVVKNSIADPAATEEAINEEIDLMFDSISDLTK